MYTALGDILWNYARRLYSYRIPSRQAWLLIHPLLLVYPHQLAITKTSGELGPNQYRNGTWDRLEGQIWSEDKQKYRGSTIAV